MDMLDRDRFHDFLWQASWLENWVNDVVATACPRQKHPQLIEMTGMTWCPCGKRSVKVSERRRDAGV